MYNDCKTCTITLHVDKLNYLWLMSATVENSFLSSIVYAFDIYIYIDVDGHVVSIVVNRLLLAHSSKKSVIHIFIYLYVFVCVCVCGWNKTNNMKKVFVRKKTILWRELKLFLTSNNERLVVIFVQRKYIKLTQTAKTYRWYRLSCA